MDAVTPDSFTAMALFLRADWVVKTVMIGLAAASLWSWAIILDKLLRFSAMNRQADAFEDRIASGRSLEDVAAEAGDKPKAPLPRMLQAALREWREARGKGALNDAQSAMLIQRIDRALDGVIARENAKAEEGLGTLAIVATASPFIGLFGTVWGIMHAFQAIAVQKNTNLAVVAPSIAEALFATAIGLAAAIPAYIAYNKFSTDAGKLSGRLETFADDLSASVARRLGAYAVALSQDGAGGGARRGRRRGRARKALSEINVTPLVDVMLVLLIIFMIAAPLLTVGVPVELPKTEAGAMDEQSEPLTVSIQADGRIFIQDSETPFEALAAGMQALAGAGFDKPIYVRADGQASYETVARVMASLAAAGFTSIGLITDTGGPSSGARDAAPQEPQ